MEIETAARKHLLTFASVRGYVQEKVYKYSLLQHVDGTGGLALVVRRSNGWTNPDVLNTQEFPVLMIDCWADCDRENGEPVLDNSADKAFALYRVVDKILHGRIDEWWGAVGNDTGLRVIQSSRGAEPFFATAKDVHGGSGNSPDTPRGESTVVTVSYNLTVAH